MRRSACKVRCELDEAHAEHRRPHVLVLLKRIEKLRHRDPRRRAQLGQHRQSSLSPQIFVASLKRLLEQRADIKHCVVVGQAGRSRALTLGGL